MRTHKAPSGSQAGNGQHIFVSTPAGHGAGRPPGPKPSFFDHPGHPDCHREIGYCPESEHRVRDTEGFTSPHHKAMARFGADSRIGVHSIVALAQMVRVDPVADRLLRIAAQEGIHELAWEVRRQQLHRVYGIRHYVSATKVARERKDARDRLTAVRTSEADLKVGRWTQPMLPFGDVAS